VAEATRLASRLTSRAKLTSRSGRFYSSANPHGVEDRRDRDATAMLGAVVVNGEVITVRNAGRDLGYPPQTARLDKTCGHQARNLAVTGRDRSREKITRGSTAFASFGRAPTFETAPPLPRTWSCSEFEEESNGATLEVPSSPYPDELRCGQRRGAERQMDDGQ